MEWGKTISAIGKVEGGFKSEFGRGKYERVLVDSLTWRTITLSRKAIRGSVKYIPHTQREEGFKGKSGRKLARHDSAPRVEQRLAKLSNQMRSLSEVLLCKDRYHEAYASEIEEAPRSLRVSKDGDGFDCSHVFSVLFRW